MDERLALADAAQRRAGIDRHAAPFTLRTSTGPSPDPISTSPCRTAADAASAAPRAASGSARPRARRAVSVAECVQPAPWVAGTSYRSTGSSTCSRPSKRWSTAVSPWPPVTSAAAGSELDEALGQVAARRAGHPRQRLRLGQVRRHDRREREEAADQRLDGVVLQQLRARAGDHDRIDHERNGMALEELRDGLDDRAREEHPRLRRVDADVVEDGVELRADEVRRQLVHGRHRRRVLGGQRDERARPVRARGGERLQVGLDAGAAARVGRGDRQRAWNHSAPFAGTSRIRFDGCDLSPARGTPVGRSEG